ncbi:unnamed protein product [Protopolystoma xenopodis]|uniref:Secreted protein n=1 Tax=Protopolystoma xenopodis TaxID=117903 RepID=A0A3S5CKI8_9PLAT|nr:unnamed protein product [Protopolystoma xenopodis]
MSCCALIFWMIFIGPLLRSVSVTGVFTPIMPGSLTLPLVQKIWPSIICIHRIAHASFPLYFFLVILVSRDPCFV